MLSAVAARKVARQYLTKAPVATEVVSNSSTPSLESTSPSKPASKRKPRSQATNSTKRSKKKKITHETPRYYAAEDSFVQDDVIIISRNDSDDEDDEDTDTDPAALPSDVQRSTLSRGKRGWSPSDPLRDSSDEEIEGDRDDLYIPDVPVPNTVLTYHY